MGLRSSGFALVEILITAFVLAVITVTVTGLLLAVTRASLESERKTVALAIANSEMENARALTFPQIEYTDASLIGKIERTKAIQRNEQMYRVDSLITLVDDPLTPKTQDFKQLTVQVSWPRARQEVTLSSLFVGKQQPSDDVCVPGTITCPNPDQRTGAFQQCPASGVCQDISSSPTPGGGGGDTDQAQACQRDQDCSAGSFCQDGTCRPNWCKIIDSAPLIDIGACQGQLVTDCTATCPSYRLIGELGTVPICGREAYCVVTQYSYERCPDELYCARRGQ